MNVEQLRHILRAAAAVTGEKVFIVIGSQAILGSHPDAPRSLRRSIEGDTYPKDNPDKAIEVDGAIGELSPFHYQFGYYSHGASPETAILPSGWEQRLVELQVNDASGTIGLCLDKHDLAFSKLAAGREKDMEYVRELLKHQLINRGKLVRLIESVVDEQLKTTLDRNWKIVLSKMP
jgi:hypothetical protein